MTFSEGMTCGRQPVVRGPLGVCEVRKAGDSALIYLLKDHSGSYEAGVSVEKVSFDASSMLSGLCSGIPQPTITVTRVQEAEKRPPLAAFL